MDPGPLFYTDKFIYCKHLFCLLTASTVLFILLQTNISFHTIHLILCFQQNRWDWQPHYKLGQSILVVLCAGSTLLLTPVVRPAKVSQQHLQKWFLSPTGRLNLGFLLRENLLLCSSYLPLGVPQQFEVCVRQAHAITGTWIVVCRITSVLID